MSATADKQRVPTSNVSTMKNKLQRDQEVDNPCLKEYSLSLKCLSDNNYIHDACEAYFKNYKNCQQFWTLVVADRARNNIVPNLPLPCDRTKVKNEYLKRFIVE